MNVAKRVGSKLIAFLYSKNNQFFKKYHDSITMTPKNDEVFKNKSKVMYKCV